ncbi:adhesin transport system outer membrane protein [Paucimonas lemoignei]|uniref:Adhesin transport system outer membrane protein n=1 Tax=Paucimonas lemoignei TaxID=29443 RepID=A0A4V6NXY5_PAULE|nr:TolC family protein [Paucimonas lemoignei]TCS36270.1 adhesin transport system outer membrane protein [Paucimonas lemoignei]
MYGKGDGFALPFSLKAVAAGVCFFISASTHAEPFPEKVTRLLREHNLMRMVDADINAAKAQVDVEQTAWFPKFNMQLSAGNQKVDRDQGLNGSFDPAERTFGLTQLLWDFGTTSKRINSAQTVVSKEGFESSLQRQNLLLAAVEAQLRLIRANQVIRYATESEDNIKRQTALENARMDAGRGYTTDVLQAKVQLAAAEARKVAAEGQLMEAVNRYKAVFGEVVSIDIPNLEGLAIPLQIMPQSLDESVGMVSQNNPDVLAADARTKVARSERDVATSRELAPRLDFALTRSRYKDWDGTLGMRDDTKAMVRLNWNFDLGMRATKVTTAADLAAQSLQEKADYVRVQATEEARNAWTSWRTAQERAVYLSNQVDIATRFLELARKERELGRRSLLDLLNGETGLINAQSEASAAKIDEVIAAYRLLRAVGRISQDIFNMPNILVKTSYVAPKKHEVRSQDVAPAPHAADFVADGQAREAIAFVKEWAAAWAAKDVQAYLAAYAGGFQPAGQSRAEWETVRTKRISQPSFIRVEIVNPQVSRENNRLKVSFVQKYASSQFSDSTRKTLVLVDEGGKLRILEERVESAASSR